MVTFEIDIELDEHHEGLLDELDSHVDGNALDQLEAQLETELQPQIERVIYDAVQRQKYEDTNFNNSPR